MAPEARFPVTDEELFEKARAALASQDWKVGGRQLAEDVPLRIGGRYAVRRVTDGRPVAYSVRILVDPRLGVPCETPDAEPRWASESVLYMMFDAEGAPVRQEEMK